MVDLLIIGAGPGGYETALHAAQLGHSVILIDRNYWGGVCLHEGCIPTKLFHHEVVNHSSIEWSALISRKEAVIDTLSNDVINALDRTGVQRVTGEARFVDSHTVQVGDHTYQGSTILIATGSTPIVPNIPGIVHPHIFTSTDILKLRQFPYRHLTILGGGYIGLEWAGILSGLKCDVKVVEALPKILGSFDDELSKRLLIMMKRQGVEFVLSTSVVGFEEANGRVKVNLSSGESFDTDGVLIAVGRRPNIDTLHLDNIGVQYTRKGIVVNEDYQTAVPHIYALGDCVGKLPLAHQAMQESQHFIKRWSKKEKSAISPFVPLVVFTHPEVASIGKTTEEAQQLGIDFKVLKVPYRANGKSVVMNETDGFVKVLIDSHKRIIGAHIIGSLATEMIHYFAMMMTLNASLSDLFSLVMAHPTQSELLRSIILASES